LFKQVIDTYELLDKANINGEKVIEFLKKRGAKNLNIKKIRKRDKSKSTDFIRITIPGSKGLLVGGKAPSLGIIGRLGGIGAQPKKIGLVSDADGAVVSIACALKILDMVNNSSRLEGDVTIVTHICPFASIRSTSTVEFMSSPLDHKIMSQMERIDNADAILSIDTTKGNFIINQKGFAITPTVKEGYILPVSTDLLRLMEVVTGRVPLVLPIVIQDITPYSNKLKHINSIMQPSTVTSAPVVGIAITTETIVPGPSTGATDLVDLEKAGRFVVEIAKYFGKKQIYFYDEEEYVKLIKLYGSMRHLQN
jgi:hypothetical protein